MKEQKTIEEIIAQFDQRIQDINTEIANLKLNNANAISFENMEQRLQMLTRELCDLTAAKQLQIALCSQSTVEESSKIIKGISHKMKNYGSRLSPVRMSNGTRVEVLSPYFARPCKEKKIVELGSIRH